MSDERQVPGPAAENNERILARPATDFARFPAEEIDEIDSPGAGPSGPVEGRPGAPVVLVVAGFLLAFATFVIHTPFLLGLGLLLVLVGTVLAAVRGRATRRPGTVTTR